MEKMFCWKIKVKEFKKLIQSNRCYKLLIPEICGKIEVKYETFKKKIKEIEGMSLKEFCNKCKLKYVKKLLETSNDKIMNIAYDVGFYDSKSFNQWFKHHILQSPSVYKTKQNEYRN